MELFNSSISCAMLLQIAWIPCSMGYSLAWQYLSENSGRKVPWQVASWMMPNRMTGKKSQPDTIQFLIMGLGKTYFYRNKQILDKQNNKSTQFSSNFLETAFRKNGIRCWSLTGYMC
jgi:hypothetical protein